MAQEANLTVFLIKTIARFVFAAMVLAAASAHAQTHTDAAIRAHPQPVFHTAPPHGGQASDSNWSKGAGG